MKRATQMLRPMAPWLGGLALHLAVGPIAAEPGADQPPGSVETLPAFHQIERVAEKKREFFDYLTPLIRMENQIILAQRARLLRIHDGWQSGQGLSAADRAFLRALGREYRLGDSNRSYQGLLDALLERVDVIPRSLALAQAAKESGWGSSRFARKANNLFGQWCFDSGCGLVPRGRPAGQTHEVRKYPSVRASVRSYVRNLNTHPSYEPLRQRRAALRSEDAPLCGVRLAEGLESYSARGSDYIREVQALIVQNHLEPASSGAMPARAMNVSVP